MERFSRGADLPVTEEIARTHLALPMSAVLDAAQAREVVAAIRAYRGAVIAESARLSAVPELPPAQAASHPSTHGPRRLVPVPDPADTATYAVTTEED